MMSGQHDQALSIDNLRAVWERANRRGRNLARELVRPGDPVDLALYALATNYSRTSTARAKLRQLRRTGGTAAQLDAMARLERALRDTRSASLDRLLAGVQKQVDDPAFRITYAGHYRVSGVWIYRLGVPYPANYLAAKLVEANVRAAFPVDGVSRDDIVAQLASVLGDNFPKTVVRGDAKQFYESIPHGALLEKLRENPRLGTSMFRLIRRFLSDYEALSGKARGLPRGISLSAALADAYMWQFDLDQRTKESTFYYARFVDDIVIVGRSTPGTSYLDELDVELRALGLSLTDKPLKRYEETYSTKTPKLPRFEFLGYGLRVERGKLSVDMSKARQARLSQRLDLAIRAFGRSKSHQGRSARLLYRRVLFLTTNTRLANNKRRAFVGIRYSNRHVGDTSQLKALDDELATRVSHLADPDLRRKLSKLSFVKGFEASRFVSLSVREIEEITSAWSGRA